MLLWRAVALLEFARQLLRQETALIQYYWKVPGVSAVLGLQDVLAG
jgi:hypothetical protein